MSKSNKNIEAIYPLSPMQQGMLFHSLEAPDSGVYCEQTNYSLTGNLNVSAFQQAWWQVVQRHSVLRTLFVWQNRKKPLQVVRSRVTLPWVEKDWRGLSPHEQHGRFEEFLEADRVRGFALGQAPLMRCALIQMAEDTYQFVLGYHHLLLDGWSLPLVLKEVLVYYEAYCGGRELHLESPRPYRDYIAWLQRQDLAQAEEFWREALRGITAPTPLPIGRGGGAWLEPCYVEQELRVSAAVTAQLQALAREHRLTLNTLVQGMWALLLSRYSEEDEVLFGATVSGRPAELRGVEAMVGLFINTLPVRVEVPPKASLLPWLQQLQGQQVEREQYMYSPLVEIQGWSEVPRGVPLFESLVVFENYPVGGALGEQRDGVELQEVRAVERTNYPLTVIAAFLGSELGFKVIYDSGRFEAATISRLLEHLQTVLGGIAADPEQRLAELPLLPEAEWQRVVVEWNATEAAYPKERCIHELFEAQVEETPEAVGVVYEEEHLTYGALNARANQLTHYLQGLGVGPEVLVGICLERSLELVVGLLGVLKAGGAYVPLDPSYPPERLAFMLEDAQAQVLLTQAHLAATLPQTVAPVLCLDREWERMAQVSKANPVSGVTPENLAYVIYTSGSTGRPKGVLVPHKGLLNLTFWHQGAFEVTSSDRATQLAALAFDASVWEIWPYLSKGASLYLVNSETLNSPIPLRDWLVSKAVTISFLPTPLAEMVLPLEWPEATALRILLTGGDKLHQYSSPSVPFRLINNYGPTENTVVTTSGRVACEGREALSPSIGRPIANTQVYLLDRHLHPVPIGVPGELYIGGASLARGYLHRPELTLESFIPHPFSEQSGARLYRTGDLARYLPDGNLEFLGRIDHQVKVRGFRIELGEIEAVLGGHPGVQEAVVVVREDLPGEKRLVAYYVGAGVEPEALRGYLRAKLPEYMVPGALVGLAALPLSPNGKVDRRALPVPERGGAEEAYVPPRTPAEELLAGIWAEVLHQERVGRYDNFFALGGDSILSIQIVARAQQAGLQLTPKQLFQYQSIAELAAVVGVGPRLKAEQGVVSGEVPLTPIQGWFFEQHLPEAHHFNQAILLEVGPELEPGWVQRVVRELLVQHDALRLRFIPEGAQWRQVHAGLEGAVPFGVVDLSGLVEAQQRPALEAVAAAQQASLNLTSGPLLRVVLFQLGPQQPGRLLMVIHHLAVDGVSWRVLLEDFQRAYEQLSRGEAIQLPPKTTAFNAWVERLWAYGHSQAVREELDYWRGVARGVVPLPRDYPADPAANTVAAAAHVGVALSAEQTRTLLQEVPPVYHTQINDVLLTALVQSMAPWTGQRTLLLGLEGHGREALFEEVNLARTVGWFTTLFPVRLALETQEPGEGLKAVKEQLRAIPHGGIGYGVLRYLHPDPAVRAALHDLPQAEVSFNYLGQLDPMLSDGSLLRPAQEGSGPPHSPRGQRPHLLDINGFVAGSRLQLQWTYSTRVHRRATVEHLAQGFLEALEALIAHCQSPEAGDYTPSDFPEVRLNQEQLESILERIASENKVHSIHPKKDVEAIYPLSPSQQGMLIETLSAPHSGIHVEQSVLRLYSDFDLKAFTRAWQQVMERHPVLRTAFVWEDLEEPLQTVLRQVKLPLQCQDWRSLTPSQQREQLEHYIDNERSQGFKLSQAPLMRLAVFQIDGQAYELVWTCHHILMDGWCKTLVQQEVLRLYEVYRQGRDLWLEPSPPYRNYIAWLRQQDSSAAEVFWRRLLKGFTRPTPLGMTAKPIDPPEQRYGNQQVYLDLEESAVLQALVQRHRLTLNSLIQGVWALLLSRYSGESDIVFGATVSGRPANIPRVESMVGLFINTLPVRIEIAPDTPLWSWLEAIQTQNQERSPYEYCAAGQVHQWSDLPSTSPLYESIVVFENYPTNESSLQQSSELDPGISETYSLGAQTHYALTLLVIPGSRLGVQMVYDRARLDDPDIGWILEHFLRLLRCILTGQEVRLAALAGQIQTDQIPQFRPLLTRQAPYIAPRDSLEQQLAEIWQEVLQVSPIGIQDNLFDLGGHSLLAVHLLARIGQQIGKPMPLAILLQGATIEQLAAILRQQSADLPWSPLVAIQPNGTKLPFFCLPGGGGNVIYLYELARHLGPDQPFYGLQAVGLDGKSRPHTRIEDMAACYIEQIRAVQPQGPYLLGGHSFGGNVAFEMSQQLQRQGQDIALLVIFDTAAPHPYDRPARSDEDETAPLVGFIQVFEAWLGKPLGISVEVLRSLKADERLDYLHELLAAARVLPAEGDRAQLRGLLEVFITNGRIRYLPPENILKTHIALLRASELPEEHIDEDQRARMREPTWGWGPFAAGPVAVHWVPGDHITMMTKPYVQVLAERLKACLNEVCDVKQSQQS